MGGERMVLKKRKKQIEGIEKLGGKGFEGLFFLHNTKTPQFGGTQKLY
jgi:hypothetical protein